MSVQESYKIIGTIAILFGTIIMVTAGVTIGQYNSYCKEQNNEKSVEDKLINSGYACIGVGAFIMVCGLIMFFGQKSRFVGSLFGPKTILFLGLLSGLITIITGVIQLSFINKISCEDEDSLTTVKNANKGCWITGIIFLIFMGVFYVSFEEEFGKDSPSSQEKPKTSSVSPAPPKLSERQLEQRELENITKRLDKALSSGEDPDEILELKAERAKLLTSIERRRSALKRQVEEAEREKESSRKVDSRDSSSYTRSSSAYPRGTIAILPNVKTPIEPPRESSSSTIMPTPRQPILRDVGESRVDLRFQKYRKNKK